MSDAETTPASAPKQWGILATLAWALLATGLSIAVGYPAVLWWQGNDSELTKEITSDGLVFAALTCLTTPVQVAVLVLAARLAKWPAKEYLGLVRPSRREAALALWVMVVFALGFDGLTVVLGREVVTPFQIDTYYTAREQGGLLLLYFAFVIVAPAGEEILFRGFLYRGWASSPRAIFPAILAISAAWAGMHIQYDWFGITQIFLVGLLFGWIRWRSGSTLLTIFLHSLLNAWATLQTAVKVEWLT